MTDASFATLNPTLLARKGGAKPAMRPQAAILESLPLAVNGAPLEDLGWNDLGDDGEPRSAEIVELSPPQGRRARIVEQQPTIARTRPRQSAHEQGKRAAFTLRLDAERHLKLRLASTLRSRSAQELVTDALDALLDAMPDVAALANQVGTKQ